MARDRFRSGALGDAERETHVRLAAHRLASEFDRDAATVETQVRAEFERWRGARVQNFVPVMVERAVRERLRAAR